MSQANVEIVRRVYEAVARRDGETVLALYDPEIEFDFTRMVFPGLQGVYRGHDGLRSWFRAWYEAWETLENVVEELEDAGEQVISVQRLRARGRRSGAELEGVRAWAVWTIRDGRVGRLAWYPSREEALADIGLDSEAGEQN